MSIEALEEVEIDYRLSSRDESKVSLVRLEWTPSWWYDIANMEEGSLPSCCSNISRVRDILVHALRMNGWIECRALFECISLIGGHGWDEVLAEGYTDFNIDDPIVDLIRIWRRVEDVAEIHPPEESLDPNNLDHAIRIFSNSMRKLDWDQLFELFEPKTCSFSDRVGRAILLAKALPAMKTIHDRLREKDFGSVVGHAAVFEDRPDELISTTLGPAIFENEADLGEAVARWMKSDPGLRILSRPVSINLDHGLRFLDVKPKTDEREIFTTQIKTEELDPEDLDKLTKLLRQDPRLFDDPYPDEYVVIGPAGNIVFHGPDRKAAVDACYAESGETTLIPPKSERSEPPMRRS